MDSATKGSADPHRASPRPMLALRHLTLRPRMQYSPPIHRTASSRARLPRLPVPDLHQTLQRYLKSLEPFLLEDERHGGPTYASALAQRTQWAADFENGLGRVLQSRLQGTYRPSSQNWLR